MYLRAFLKYANGPMVIVARSCSRLAYYHHIGKTPILYDNIGQQVQKCVEKYGNRIALYSHYDDTQVTFAEAYEEASTMAVKLEEMGLQRGDHMAIWAPNTKQWYITFLASALGGFPLACLNHALQKPELEYALQKAKVKLVVTMDSYGKSNFASILNEMNTNGLKVVMKSPKKQDKFFNYDDIFRTKPEPHKICNLRLEAIAHQPEKPLSIQFTSGTTGQPKAALLSHFAMVNQAIHMGSTLLLHEGPKTVCMTVPMFHIFGFCVVAAALNYGSTLCLPSPTFNAQAALEAVEKYRCNVLLGTPTMFVDMVDNQKRLQKNTLSLDLALMGGSACSPEVVQRTRQVLQVSNVRLGYGMSESSGLVFADDGTESPDKAMLSCGKLLPHAEAKIVDNNGNTVKIGEMGELWLRGWFSMLGYFEDEENTKKTLDSSGWLKTGDKFILDPNGVGRYQGRKKDLIIRGGENIYPKEVEDFLNSHPSILESQIIGVPDERMGEEICAYIRLKDEVETLTLDDIKAFCKGQLAHFKVPKYLRIATEFPKTTSGKIQKFKLQEMFKDGQK
ncbi:medium-chain acyl-CoA ligase ACSF2, mitochondrial-like [Haematobia irritans]|uniref:medium-chain acyl-CoA ligase ACSF2, mitochondrial-like n=1 Tax=Haematobia irritans TaxID=7368 RepID=UPI003F5024C0